MNFNDYSDDIVFGFNTRTGGVSTGVYDSMNLSLTLPDDPEDAIPTTWFGWMSATRGRDSFEPE